MPAHEWSLEWSAPLSRRGGVLLFAALLVGLCTHAYNLFRYPLFLPDEGIYTEQAWSVVRESRLSPYTYFYDHAPGGWLLIAGWTMLMPGQFHAFGGGLNVGRMLMLCVHLASVFFMFEITRRLSGSLAGATIATFLFNVSPLAVYYQRQVLLDNLMVFWMLLALYLLVRRDGKLGSAVGSGVAFGFALITKENAIFLAPAFAYLLRQSFADQINRRFARSLWWFTAAVPVTGYVLTAQLKNELVPSGLSFNLSQPPTDHVSLLYTVWWQINRTPYGGPGDAFADLLKVAWLPKDRFLIIAGALGSVACLYLGWQQKLRRPGPLIVGLLSLGYGFYLTRSVLLEFYVAPLVALLVLNIGVLAGLLARQAPSGVSATATIVLIAIALALPGGYLVKYDDTGRLRPHDLYALSLTAMQQAQVDWIRHNVPPEAKMIIDDDIWVQLHDGKPSYPNAHSHWKAGADPEIRDDLFHRDWREVDYIALSNKTRPAMEQNNANGQANWIFEALDGHGEQVWHVSKGDVELAVYRIAK
jgi:4-amino-4-deoxy-L-arabinose transferase-like glycosyltransferase